MLLLQIILNEPTIHYLLVAFVSFEVWKIKKIFSIDKKISLVIMRQNACPCVNSNQAIPDNDK